MTKKNPSAATHRRVGRDYLKKAHSYWTRYCKDFRSDDLLDAYKYLAIAHEELKYAKDKESLGEAKRGLKVADTELKKCLRA